MKAIRMTVWLPAPLIKRARVAAGQCGLNVRQLVAQVVHAGLAERCCVHQAPAPAAAPQAEAAESP